MHKPASLLAIIVPVICTLVATARAQRARIGEEPVYDATAGMITCLDPATGEGKFSLKYKEQALGKPVVIGKTLYFNGTRTVYALDAASGESKWNFAAPGIVLGITADADRVFVGAGSSLVALDPATGKQLWQCDSDLAIADPQVVDDKVIFNTVEGPAAIDQQTGKLKWQLAMRWGYFVFSPLPEHRLCVWKPDEIFVIETDKGKALWHSAADQSNTAPGALPSPAAATGKVICQLRGTPRDANDWYLIARESDSGRQLWRTALGQHETPSGKTVLADKTAYCVLADNLTAINLADGKIKWQSTVKPLEAGGATLIADHGNIYIPQLGGNLTALDEKTGKEKWTSPAMKPSPRGRIRVGGICVSESGIYITRNDEQRQ